MDRPSKEVVIPAPWGNITGMWWGPEGKQPVIFLHGWQENGGSFNRLISLLPKELSYLCLDFPGHGFSDPFPKGTYYYIFWDFLLAFQRVVKHFDWNKITIVGHSLGGAVGFMYASVYPDIVEKLVCIDIVSPRVATPTSQVAQYRDSIENFFKYEKLTMSSQPCYEYEEMVQVALGGYKGAIGREGVVELLKRGMRPAEQKPGKYYFCRDIRLKVAALGIPALDVTLEMATKLKCHYLNIRAKEGLQFEDPTLYPLVLGKIKTSVASFNYQEVPGNHHVHLNNPENISEILLDFLLDPDPTSQEVKINGN